MGSLCQGKEGHQDVLLDCIELRCFTCLMIIMVVGRVHMTQPPDVIAVVIHDYNICLIRVVHMVNARPKRLQVIMQLKPGDLRSMYWIRSWTPLCNLHIAFMEAQHGN